MKLPANQEIVIEGNTMEIKAVLNPAGTSMIEMCVLRSTDKLKYMRIVLYPERGLAHSQRFDSPQRCESLISIDSSFSSTLPDVKCRAPESAPVIIKKGEYLDLRVFIDRSVVEVFVNDRQCIAVRVYPGREDSVGVSLRSQGKDAQLMSLDA